MNEPEEAAPPTKAASMFSRLILLFGTVAITAIVLFLIACLIDYVRHQNHLRRVAEVSVGATKDEVIEIMGRPTVEWPAGTDMFLGGKRENDTWLYGRDFNLAGSFVPEWPFFFPFIFRFAPLDEDVKLEFDPEGQVISIYIPDP